MNEVERYFPSRFKDGKKDLNELLIGLTLDVLTFVCNIIRTQNRRISEVACQIYNRKITVHEQYIDNVLFNGTDGRVSFIMSGYNFEQNNSSITLMF